MNHPNLTVALEYGKDLLAHDGNIKLMLAYDVPQGIWQTYNCSTVEGILEFADQVSIRPICLLQHQMCKTTIALPNFPVLEDHLTAWAGTQAPIQSQPTLQTFIDDLPKEQETEKVEPNQTDGQG